MASRVERSETSASRDLCRASAAEVASTTFLSDSVKKQNKKNEKSGRLTQSAKGAKVKNTGLTLGSLLVLRRAPIPAGHLTLSSSKVGLSLVQGKVFFGEQSLKPSNLALIPLSHRLLHLGFLGKDPDPLLQGGELVPGLLSLGCQCGALLPKLGRDLALLSELPLSRLPSSPFILTGRPGISFPAEKD